MVKFFTLSSAILLAASTLIGAVPVNDAEGSHELEARATPPKCFVSQQLSADGKKCVPCTLLDPNASRCSGGRIQACLKGTLDTTRNVCVSVSCGIQEMSTPNLVGCIACASLDKNAVTCESGKITSCLLGSLNPERTKCGVPRCSALQTLNADGTRCIDCKSLAADAVACSGGRVLTCGKGSLLGLFSLGTPICRVITLPSLPL